MTSKAIILCVGLPMVIFGAFIALAIAPLAVGVESTIEFVGSLIGILGVVFMISGYVLQERNSCSRITVPA